MTGQCHTIMATSKIEKSYIHGDVKIYGFANKKFVQLHHLSSSQYYGTATVITNDGTMTVELKGYDDTSTTTTGNIKTYKHNNNGVLDYQFVFNTAYTHGVLIISGSAAQCDLVVSPL